MRTKALAYLTAVLLLACGDMHDAAFERGGDEGGNGGTAPEPGAGAQPPQEREIESDYEAPVATGRYVWIANPKSGRVAFVDAETLQVRTVEAGNGPTHLAGVPGQDDDTTVVLNVLSEDATVLRATPQGITTRTIKTAAHANSLAFSSDGRFAIAWADSRKAPSAPRTEGFQDLTVMDLTTGTSTILAVGYRPVTVGFAAGAPRAYAVTQDGVAIVALSGTPRVERNVAIADDPAEDPGTRDVFVTNDGEHAFVRRDGQADITAVSLTGGGRTTITLSGPVTDLDLSDTGTRAVAVVRDQSEAVILPIPGIVDDPGDFTTVSIPGQTFGSVSLAPGGGLGLLYTNATAVERLTLLDLESSEFRTVRLYSAVLGVFSSPDAEHALVLHDRTEGAEGGTPGAFSLVPVAEVLPAKIVPTRARPSAVAMANDRAVVAERDDQANVFGVYLARMPQLMVERFSLASPPTAVGIVAAANRAYVAQLHPEGRITFVDLDTGVARTLTGFELSSRVVDGSKP
jgi:hypothetical protein